MGYYSELESNKKQPNFQRLSDLAEFFGCCVGELFDPVTCRAAERASEAEKIASRLAALDEGDLRTVEVLVDHLLQHKAQR